ncbi:MAG: calcium-binding protein [Paracoccaceae bacterium]
MTTYTFTGLRLTTNASGVPTSVAPVTFKLVVSDDYRFGYENLGTNGIGTEIAIAPTVGNSFSATIDGRLVDQNWFPAMFRVDRPGGQSTDTNMLGFFDAATSRDYLFEISGPRLPQITTLAQFAAFQQSNTFNALWTRPLVDSTQINPATFTSLTAVTQNDVINLAGQTWTNGVIRAGLGNDRVIGTSAADQIDLGVGNDIGRGGLGSDSILGQAGNDQLFGERGNDTLNGGVGADVLDGGADLDRLIGGADADRFIFKAGYSRDTIVAFEDRLDKIDLSSFNLTLTQVLNAATEVGNNVRIDFGGGDVLTILNTTEAILRGDMIL